MSSNLPQIISLTTLCTAGCSHCPYSSVDLEKLFLNPATVEKIANNSSKKLIVLTGGEPLLHPQITEILTRLIASSTPFRLATGGFVHFNSWMDQFKFLYGQAVLQGISIGTDVISQRVSSSKWVNTWCSNILLLQEHGIPYSLTLTIDPLLEFKWLDIWKWEGFKKCPPHFIYIRYFNEDNKERWIRKIIEIFGGILTIEDRLDYLNS